MPPRRRNNNEDLVPRLDRLEGTVGNINGQLELISRVLPQLLQLLERRQKKNKNFDQEHGGEGYIPSEEESDSSSSSSQLIVNVEHGDREFHGNPNGRGGRDYGRGRGNHGGHGGRGDHDGNGPRRGNRHNGNNGGDSQGTTDYGSDSGRDRKSSKDSLKRSEIPEPIKTM